MVNKNQVEYVQEKIGRAIHPYDSVSPLTTEEALDQYSAWMEGEGWFEGFKDADKIVYHSGSSPEEDDLRITLLEAVALDMKGKGEDPEIYLDQELSYIVHSSEILEDDDVTYHDAETLEEEIREPFRTSSDGRSIHITSDYEADTVYRFRDSFDSSEFIVLSADTSELDDEVSALDHLRERWREPDWS